MSKEYIAKNIKTLYIDYVSYLHGIKTFDYTNFKLDVNNKQALILDILNYIDNGGNVEKTFLYIDISTNYTDFKWIETTNYNHLKDLFVAYSDLYIHNLV